jgi:hypothetical protein
MVLLPPQEYDGPDSVLTADDYQRAIDTQGACNASGLCHSLSAAMSRVFDEAQARDKGTDWYNGHPIVFLYVAQIASLSGVAYVVGDLDRYSWCCRYCEARKEAQPCATAHSEPSTVETTDTPAGHVAKTASSAA